MNKTAEKDFSIVDRPKEIAEKPVKEEDILYALLTDKAIEKLVKTDRGTFTVRYPAGKDRLKIDQYRALRRRGIPAMCFDDVANTNNNIWSTLDVAIVDGPEWYKEIRKNNPAWSWEEEPDEKLVMQLFDMVSSFRMDIAKRIDESRFGKPLEEYPISELPASMGDGAFSGLANRQPD
jgi:hypothetical protein